MSYLTNGYGNNTAQIGRQAHPDVLTNIIAQRIIALGMSKDPSFRGDINSTLGNRFILVTGQASSSNLPTESEIISEVLGAIESAGYTRNGTYNPLERQVLVDIDGQSPNISNSVGNGGAGDTVVKHGFATNTTKEFLPLPHILAKEIAKRLDWAFSDHEIEGLGPDGKINVKIRYGNGNPEYASGVVVAAQHYPCTDLEEFRREITNRIVVPALGRWYRPFKTEIVINGAGLFEFAGPVTDRGAKGKKDADSTYGDSSRHTGGSSYGKDPTKVDFHALVSARHIAKSIVASGLAESIEVRLGYRIGGEQPWVLEFDTLGTGRIANDELEALVRKNFPLAPKEVIAELDLRRPWIYPLTATEHFFGDSRFPWENAKQLK